MTSRECGRPVACFLSGRCLATPRVSHDRASEGLVMDKERIARELIGIVGSDGVATDPGELRVYETDGLTIFKAMPDIVVLPRSAEQVAGVVKVCHRERIPFVARGAGTGLSGGARSEERRVGKECRSRWSPD